MEIDPSSVLKTALGQFIVIEFAGLESEPLCTVDARTQLRACSACLLVDRALPSRDRSSARPTGAWHSAKSHQQHEMASRAIHSICVVHIDKRSELWLYARCIHILNGQSGCFTCPHLTCASTEGLWNSTKSTISSIWQRR